MSEPTRDQVYGTLTEIGLPGMDARFHTERLRELLAAFRAGARFDGDGAISDGCQQRDPSDSSFEGADPPPGVRAAVPARDDERERLAAISKLHRPTNHVSTQWPLGRAKICDHCRKPWPCLTSTLAAVPLPEGQEGTCMNQVRVTAQDIATGESESVELTDDYVLTCAGSAYIAAIQTYANGTHVITVKGRAASPVTAETNNAEEAK